MDCRVIEKEKKENGPLSYRNCVVLDSHTSAEASTV
jgi:hypothetical protein